MRSPFPAAALQNEAVTTAAACTSYL